MPEADCPIIAVLGATGNQGGGVIRALLARHPNEFHIRAITRDSASPRAQSLIQDHNGVSKMSICQANVDDEESLRRAFENAWGVFAVTNHRASNGAINSEKDLLHELTAGQNIISAAQHCKVQHFVISSLPNIARASDGRFKKVYHFDHKSQIEEAARSCLPSVTALLPGLFYTNMFWSQYCRREDNGNVRFCAAVSGDTVTEWADPCHDIGLYASEVFARGPEVTRSQRYPVNGPKIPFDAFPDLFTKVTGQPAIFEPITMGEWGEIVAARVGQGFEEDIRQMAQWISVAPVEKICYGTINSSQDLSYEHLGLKASTFEDWLCRTRWNGPPRGQGI